jgi:hypothetical protein
MLILSCRLITLNAEYGTILRRAIGNIPDFLRPHGSCLGVIPYVNRKQDGKTKWNSVMTP